MEINKVLKKYWKTIKETKTDKIEIDKKELELILIEHEKLIEHIRKTNNILELIKNGLIKLEHTDKTEHLELYEYLDKNKTKYEIFKIICNHYLNNKETYLNNRKIIKKTGYTKSYVSTILKDLKQRDLIKQIPIIKGYNNIPTDLGLEIYNNIGDYKL